MLTIPPPQRRTRRIRAGKPTPALEKATYQAAASVTLFFNQPVDITAIATNSFTLNDAPMSKLYVGQSATLLDPLTVKITLMYITAITGSAITLDVDDQNNIKPLDGAAPWGGASGLVLPYP